MVGAHPSMPDTLDGNERTNEHKQMNEERMDEIWVLNKYLVSVARIRF